jgi:hypothetical protein
LLIELVAKWTAIQESNSKTQEMLISMMKKSPPRSTGSSVSSLTTSAAGNHQASTKAGEKTPSPTSSNDSKRVSFDTQPPPVETIADDIVVEEVSESSAIDISSTMAELNFGRGDDSVDTGVDSGHFTFGSG